MLQDPFSCCIILCIVFLFFNIKQVGLTGKSIILPSTIFAFMWGWTSLGMVILRFLNNATMDNLPHNLAEIGNYQFNILLTCFCAFLLARILTRHSRFVRIDDLSKNFDIPLLVKRLRWILYLFCVLGLFRLGMVISSSGLNMGSMREHYLTSRTGFGAFDTNLIRISQYVLQFTVFYICLLGLNSALYGLNIKQTLKNFLIFMPYQFSFGGRLYILSFFIPFIISYLVLYFIKPKEFFHNKTEIKKIGYLICLTMFLVVVMQIVKTGKTSHSDTINSGGELFYSTSSYIHIFSLFEDLPEEDELNLGLGRNISPWFTSPSEEYTKVLEGWEAKSNPAIFCVPSMIPDMYLDFGKIGSYFVYFIIFFFIEFYAIKSMKKYSFQNFTTYILLCIFAFNTVTSSMSDNFRTLFIDLLFLYLFTKYYIPKITHANIQS